MIIFDQLLFELLTPTICDLLLASVGILGGGSLFQTLIALNRLAHHSAFTAARSVDNLTWLAALPLLFERLFLLEDSSATPLHSLRILLANLILSLLVLRSALLVLAFVLLGSSDCVPLTLHQVGTLVVVVVALLARSLFAATTRHTAQLLVSLDQVIKRLIVHCVVHQSVKSQTDVECSSLCHLKISS